MCLSLHDIEINLWAEVIFFPNKRSRVCFRIKINKNKANFASITQILPQEIPFY